MIARFFPAARAQVDFGHLASRRVRVAAAVGYLRSVPFSEFVEIEGSTYRVNGREVRARDVQLLFADASTGANSPALVRQGQISELIAAKPQNRRRILEEAGGVAGLHTRRHEAELRLKAAETNLDRLDDIGRELETALNRLKREARQAVTLAEQQAAQERIAKLERQKTRQRREIYDVEDDIDAKRNQLIDQLTQRMTQQVQTEHLFTLQWTVA